MVSKRGTYYVCDGKALEGLENPGLVRSSGLGAPSGDHRIFIGGNVATKEQKLRAWHGLLTTSPTTPSERDCAASL